MIRSDNKFWGRRKEIRDIYSLLLDSDDEPQSVALIGLRRMGKSSLLFRIEKKRDAEPHYEEQLSKTVCVMLSMQGLSNASVDDFYTTLIDELCTRKELIGSDILAFTTFSQEKNYQMFSRLLRWLDGLGFLLVLLLDEFECAATNPNYDKHFFDQLRSIAQQWRVAYVVAAQQDLAKLWDGELVSSPYSSPFFNFFQTITVAGFEQGSAENYISFALNATKVSFTQEEIGIARTFGGDHPFFVNLAAYHVFQYLVHSGDGVRSADNNLQTTISEDPTLYSNFAYYWDILTPERRNILRQVIEHRLETPYRSDVAVDLGWLNRMGLLHVCSNGEIKPFSKAFGEFVLQCEQDRAFASLAISAEQESLEGIITQDESATLEYKSSLRWDLRERKKADYIEEAVMKTIAAFLNSDGGLLIIGVDDQGEIVGIENDYQTLKKKDRDGFELHLATMISDGLSKTCCQYIHPSFHILNGHEICACRVESSPQPVYYGKDHVFFIRTLNSTRSLNLKEAVEYVKEHW